MGVVGPDFSKEGKDATDLRDVGAGTGFFNCRCEGEVMGEEVGEEFGCVLGCQRSSTELFRPSFAGRDLSGEGPDCCSS